MVFWCCVARERMGWYAKAVRKIALLLMDSILDMESRGLGPAYLKEKLEEGMQVMVMNCSYLLRIRAMDASPTFCRAAKASTSLTRRDVPEAPDTLHVHIGDHLEVMSNGKYKRLVHRAVLNSQKRISIASIHRLSMNEKVTTAEELVDEQHNKGYRDSSFLDFLDFITSTNKTGGRNFIDSLMLTGN